MSRRETLIRIAIAIPAACAIPAFALAASTWHWFAEGAVALFFVVMFGLLGWCVANMVRIGSDE
jgi:hypothetical protein